MHSKRPQKLLYLFCLAFFQLSGVWAVQAAEPSTAELVQTAIQAVQLAEQNQAPSLASTCFEQAQAALQQAQQLSDKGKNRESSRWANQARGQADLCRYQALYAQMKQDVENKSARNNQLRRELFLEQQP